MWMKNTNYPDSVIHQWRMTILNYFFGVAAIISLPAIVAIIANALSRPEVWPIAIAFLVIEVFLIALAISRNLPIKIRVWGLWIVGYTAAILNLANSGLSGASPLYLLAMPILVLILVGKRSSIIASVFSVLLAVISTILIDMDLLVPNLVGRNPWSGFTTFLMFLTVVMTILILFYRLQERLIDEERQTKTELLHAQLLLEEQNTTLEQKIQEGLGELQASNLKLVQRNAELTLINSVSAAMTKSLDVKMMARIVGDKVREIFDVDSALIMLIDRQTNLIHVPYEFDKNEGGYIYYVEPFPLGTGLSSKVITSGQPLMASTLEEEIANGAYFPPEIIEKGSGFFSQSWLGVPIMANEQVLGLLALADARPYAFDENHKRLLQTLSSNLGAALENARLFSESQHLLKETEQRNKELGIINRVQVSLASKLDLQAVFELIGEKVCDVFNVQVVDVVTYDSDTNLISMPYSYEKGDRSVITPREPYGFRLQVINSGEPLLINQNFAELANQHNNPLLTGEMPKSALFVPLSADNQVIGVISIQDLDRENAFSASDVRLLQTLSNAMSVAMENACLFDETQRLLKETDQRAAELATINTVSSALSSELDLDALINLVGEQVRSIFKADIVYVALLDRQNHVINFPYKYGDKHEPLPLGQGLTSKVIQSGEPLLITREIEQRRKELGTTLVGKSVRSYLGVPIFVGGEAVGVISVQNAIQEDAFNEKDQHLLSTIASNVGTALQNARLFEEIKHQEQHAHEMQRRLADIINFLPDATLVIDHEGQVIAWNRAIEEMTDIAASDMLGKGNHEYALPFYGERRPILIDLVLSPQKDMEKKYSHIHREGGILSGETFTPALKDGGRYLYATASALHDGEGKIVGAIEIIRDTTERMHAEEELRKAKAEAEQANHAKSAFLANMSHELRTPLNAIIGFTRIVRRKGEGLLPEKQIENLDKVLTSADNLLNLINTVLDIAKIEAGRMDVLPANFRLAPLIDLCANTAQPLLQPEVMLEIQVDESITTIYSDQDKIRQIVLNLLSNAAKFTPGGKISLTAEQHGENLHINVSDTGIGISAEALPNIFKEFEQADATTTRKYGGTGLGLTISRNLARLLGGDLNVESEFGQGSTFTLVIPVHYERDLSQLEASTLPVSDLQPAPVSDIAPHTEAGSAKKHILVIDDDPDAVYLLQENLDRQEFEVSSCRNGLDGLQLARKQQPQAILLDILMPGADGWQVLHELKNDPSTANIPVILHTIVDRKTLGFQLGAAAYLLKPLDPVAVRETLDRVIVQDGHKPKRVLVVDDDPNVADMLRQFLPESDFSLESALDGLAGLKSIEANRPDILLLDLLMPNLDGFGVIERLRANPRMCDLPIIVISAKDLTADESDSLKETVAVVMKKQGFQGERLVDEINHVLGKNLAFEPS